jgi:transcriptional regulator with XRE-family HTH domain
MGPEAEALERTGRNIEMGKNVSYAQWSLESYSIGLKLRSLRTQKRLTLARLGAETGLSTALLSKLETDRMVPTLSTLAMISRVYGVGLSHFFQEPGRHTLSITRKAHLQGHERGAEHFKITPLNAVEAGLRIAASAEEASGPTPVAGKERSQRAAHGAQGAHQGAHGTRPARREPRLVAQMIEFPAGGAACTSDCLHHTNGLMYVLEGQLQLESGVLHELLETGDCVYVDSDMALAWSAAGKRRCRVLAVFPGGEAETGS